MRRYNDNQIMFVDVVFAVVVIVDVYKVGDMESLVALIYVDVDVVAAIMLVMSTAFWWR